MGKHFNEKSAIDKINGVRALDHKTLTLGELNTHSVFFLIYQRWFVLVKRPSIALVLP